MILQPCVVRKPPLRPIYRHLCTAAVCAIAAFGVLRVATPSSAPSVAPRGEELCRGYSSGVLVTEPSTLTVPNTYPNDANSTLTINSTQQLNARWYTPIVLGAP